VPSPRQTSRSREVIAGLYLFSLAVSFYLSLSAKSYRPWATFGVIFALLLLGSVPVAIALILVPRRREASLVAPDALAHHTGLARPSVVAPKILLAVGAVLMLFVIVIGYLWPDP
jgi:hypothetical protein